MKDLLGILFIIIGALLGLYIGLWHMFIGGIMGIALAVDTHTITVSLIAWNLIKMFFATPVGIFIFGVCGGLGSLLWD